MIEIKNLKKEFDNVTPLKDVSVSINDGDVISVIGPSGTGKSTFIRCINLLEKPTSGQILVNGEDITAKGVDIKKVRQKMGMVFQSFNLFGHLTVIENLMLAPMDLLKISKQEAYDKGMELLDRVGLSERNHWYIYLHIHQEYSVSKCPRIAWPYMSLPPTEHSSSFAP